MYCIFTSIKSNPSVKILFLSFLAQNTLPTTQFITQMLCLSFLLALFSDIRYFVLCLFELFDAFDCDLCVQLFTYNN